MNLMSHYIDACTCSAGHKRRKRSGWAGPVCAVLVVLAVVALGAL